MIIDTSAIIAVLRNEPEAASFIPGTAASSTAIGSALLPCVCSQFANFKLRPACRIRRRPYVAWPRSFQHPSPVPEMGMLCGPVEYGA